MRRAKLTSALGLCATFALLAPISAARAELKPEQLHVEALAEAMRPHWVWINDLSFDRMTEGRAYLVDADNGKLLGMVNGGFNHGSIFLDPAGQKFAIASTFYSRGTRGERTDVVTFYKTSDLKPAAEVVIPPKRYGGMPFPAALPITPDGRFGLIYNFTPEQSVTVVDLASQSLVGEYPTAGCGLIYPTGQRSFLMLCGDGSIQPATLSPKGEVTLGKPTKPLFDKDDPVTEKGVWTGSSWLFFTMSGKVYEIGGAEDSKVSATWSLVEGDASWRPGAFQTAAVHQRSGRLFVLMHQGGPATHKDPGSEIWVFDLKKRTRVARLRLDSPAMSVAVSQDSKPLLYTTMFEDPALKIYDATSLQLLRRVGELGRTSTVIQPSPLAEAR